MLASKFIIMQIVSFQGVETYNGKAADCTLPADLSYPISLSIPLNRIGLHEHWHIDRLEPDGDVVTHTCQYSVLPEYK